MVQPNNNRPDRLHPKHTTEEHDGTGVILLGLGWNGIIFVEVG